MISTASCAQRDMLFPTEIVYFNVETTGLKYHDEIIYLSAYNDLYEFHDYMKPTVPINPQASRIHGFKFHNGKLLQKGKVVELSERKEVMKDFLLYCEGTGGGGPVILVAHKGKSLAFDKLLREIDNAGMMEDFEKVVKGLCDTIPVFKASFPDRVKQNKSFKLADLHKDLTEKHECDGQKVLMIDEILSEHQIGAEEIEKHMDSWYDATMQYYQNQSKAACRESLRKVFGDHKELEKVIHKMGDYQFHLDNLVESYKKGGKAAVMIELSGESYGNPPVTKDEELLKIMADKIAQHCAKN